MTYASGVVVVGYGDAIADGFETPFTPEVSSFSCGGAEANWEGSVLAPNAHHDGLENEAPLLQPADTRMRQTALTAHTETLFRKPKS
ncbi:MAG: hypothetical protein ABGW78_08565 [Pirellulales bacterium]